MNTHTIILLLRSTSPHLSPFSTHISKELLVPGIYKLEIIKSDSKVRIFLQSVAILADPHYCKRPDEGYNLVLRPRLEFGLGLG